MTLILHRLGFHGPHWKPFWLHGNVWIECTICGARALPEPMDTYGIPPERIADESRFSEARP
jgi:hypothetical protein